MPTLEQWQAARRPLPQPEQRGRALDLTRLGVGGSGLGRFLWLKADSITLNDGELIDVWPDSSGYSRSATSSGINRPTFKTNILDGRPAVRWLQVQGNEQMALPNVFTGLTSAEVFLVVKQDADPGVGGDVGAIWTFGSDSSDHFPFQDGVVYMGWGSTVRKTVGNLTPSLAAWRVLNISSAPSDYNVRVDGTSVFSTATNTVGWTTAPRIGYAATGIPALGYWAELIMYSRVISSTERAGVLSYLKGKYPSLTI